MGEPKFKKGEFAIYVNKLEIVEIKEVIDVEETVRLRQRQDGLHGEPSGEEVTQITYKYRVWTHTGDTSALCEERLLAKIPNLYAFDIKRKRADD